MNISLYLNNVTTPIAEYEAIEMSLPSAIQNIHDGSCAEIVVGPVLDYVGLHMLPLIISKLRYNGTIQITGTDLYEVSRQFVIGQLTIQQMNTLLYANKTNLHDIRTVVQILQQHKLKILTKRVINNDYAITAQRLPTT